MDNGMFNNNGGFNNELNNSQYSQQPQQPQNNGKAIAAMVTGICSIVFACLVPIVGLVLGIIAIVFAILANKERKTGMGLAGLITGIVGTILSIVIWIVNIIIISSAQDFYSKFL